MSYILIEIYWLYASVYRDSIVYTEGESNVPYIENGGGKVFRKDDNIFPENTVSYKKEVFCIILNVIKYALLKTTTRNGVHEVGMSV